MCSGFSCCWLELDLYYVDLGLGWRGGKVGMVSWLEMQEDGSGDRDRSQDRKKLWGALSQVTWMVSWFVVFVFLGLLLLLWCPKNQKKPNIKFACQPTTGGKNRTRQEKGTSLSGKRTELHVSTYYWLKNTTDIELYVSRLTNRQSLNKNRIIDTRNFIFIQPSRTLERCGMPRWIS